MLPIKQNLTSVNYNSANKTNKYIVVHYTGNSTDTAYNNTKYFKSVNRNASAHYFVDDNSIWQCVMDKDIAWHCGDSLKKGAGGSYYGKCTNRNSIGIEMCCTNYDVSAKTEANTIELVKYLMNKYGISASNVIRHYDVTNKICPKPMVNNPNRWDNFKKALGGSAPKPSPTPSGITGDLDYQVYDNVRKAWCPQVTNDKDYAGNKGHAIGGIRVKSKYATIGVESRVNGKWLSKITSNNYVLNSNNGNTYSGIIGKNIEAIIITCDKGFVKYRVGLVDGTVLPWVDSRNASKTNPNGYAGIFGKPIAWVQMK